MAYRGELEHIVYSESFTINDNSDDIKSILNTDSDNIELTITGIIYHIYDNNWFIEKVMIDNDNYVLTNEQTKNVYLYVFNKYIERINATIDNLKQVVKYDMKTSIVL